jgi:50S ribosomal protein L16 3-hydroxylase
MKSRLLGSLTPRAFLRRHWQKRPLFVQAALPQIGKLSNLGNLPDGRALAALAARDDVESRIVERRGSRWQTTHGPFKKASLRKTNATLLVSGVNLHLRAADRLLRRFDFIPQARLDDVMVSFATPGGGVGPHTDSYDVFLIQGEGTRKWTVWSPGGSMKITHIAEAGDLLYLPPGWKHDGVALQPCFTYSIGFRAPRGAELGAAFLDFLHERGLPDAIYRDADLTPVTKAASLPVRMIHFTKRLLKRIRWSRSDVVRFLGEYLTQPKSHVVFRPTRSKGSWIRLDPKTQLLYCGGCFFINGEAFAVPKRHRDAMRKLADRRRGELAGLAGQAKLIGEWRHSGYLHLGKRDA